ncbi:MAG: UDP-3-O-(3-hydroxymyristoyl)glucosamine N-acyltransferase [Bacteroidales bacterium]
MLEFTLSQIAEILGGKVDGDPNKKVYTLCKIEEGCEGGLSFLSNPQYTPYVYTSKATAIIVNADFKAENPLTTSLIRVEDSYQAFARLLSFYNEHTMPKTGISEFAFIASDAVIGKNVYIGEFAVISSGAVIGDDAKIFPQCYIGNQTQIGEHSILYAGVKVYPDNKIGKNCVLHAGAVIGADGFGFAPNNGTYNKIPQIGNVILQDNVEIGANTCVDKATLGSTIVEEGVKLDNLIQIGHNVVIGKNTVMAAQGGIAGSTKIGENCMIGGQVGVTGHVHIANGVMLGAQCGVTGSVNRENTVLLGSPSLDVSTFRRSSVHFKNLEKIVQRIENLEKKLGEQK